MYIFEIFYYNVFLYATAFDQNFLVIFDIL